MEIKTTIGVSPTFDLLRDPEYLKAQAELVYAQSAPVYSDQLFTSLCDLTENSTSRTPTATPSTTSRTSRTPSPTRATRHRWSRRPRRACARSKTAGGCLRGSRSNMICNCARCGTAMSLMWSLSCSPRSSHGRVSPPSQGSIVCALNGLDDTAPPQPGTLYVCRGV